MSKEIKTSHFQRFYDNWQTNENCPYTSFEEFLETWKHDMADMTAINGTTIPLYQEYKCAILVGIIEINEVPEEYRISKRAIWTYAFRHACSQYKRIVNDAKKYYTEILEQLEKDIANSSSSNKTMLEEVYGEYNDIEGRLKGCDLLDPINFWCSEKNSKRSEDEKE